MSVDYREILLRGRSREPDHAASKNRHARRAETARDRRGVPVLHADSPTDRRESLVLVALDGRRIVSLRDFHAGLRDQDGCDDISWSMTRDAAEELNLDRIGQTVAIDLAVGTELLEKIDELFPKIEDKS